MPFFYIETYNDANLNKGPLQKQKKLKVISISQLQPGMFVQSVTKQTGCIKIKNQGWVKTQASIDKLKKAGILEIEIDPESSFSYVPMPILASLIEKLFSAKKADALEIKKAIKNDLISKVPKALDYLVLGCTHYGLIDRFISETMEVQTICPSSSLITGQSLSPTLTLLPILSKLP